MFATRSSLITCLFAAYVLLVRLLRYRRLTTSFAAKKYKNRDGYSEMTLADAYQIQLALPETEFPTVFSSSVFFALFKTYGIPSISRLLIATGQLANNETASKRAADTGIILTEIVLNSPTSDRTIDGIARMNYLHDRYRNAGKISDEDMLYTLSLFALEPIRWTNRYEWRKITELERCAMGTFWRNMGESMNIPFTLLSCHESGWKDGLQWLDDLESWSTRYEKANMVPAPSNNKLGLVTLDLALYRLPKALHGVGRQFAACLLEPRLRQAMSIEEPGLLLSTTVSVLFTMRKYFIRYLMLPRPYAMRKRWFSEIPDPATGRHHPARAIAHPWYIARSTYSCWGPKAWLTWTLGKPLPGDEGSKYEPEGYLLTELGPAALKHKGHIEMEQERQRARGLGTRMGCPFAKW